jgi:type II secretory pathway pseudopilin PulG
MMEIVLCLAIVGFALVSNLLVLPSGMNTQSQTREETIVGEDASVLLEAIRGGARGLDDLTNNVYAITNYYQFYNANGIPVPGIHTAGYTYSSASINNGSDIPAMHLTNGLRIIGLLSTPEYTAGESLPGPGGSLLCGAALAYTNGLTSFYTSNHVVAYVHSLSGLAVEKPPQNNQIMQGNAFSYRLLCVNAPMAMDPNLLQQPGLAQELAGSLRELRILFQWPLTPNGVLAQNFHIQNFRATIGGQLIMTNYSQYLYAGNYPFSGIGTLYFYQTGSFTNTP